MKFCQNLRRLMAEKGLSPAALAGRMYGWKIDNHGNRVARGYYYVAGWVYGSRIPDRAHLEKLAKALNVKPDDLMDAAIERPTSEGSNQRRRTWTNCR